MQPFICFFISFSKILEILSKTLNGMQFSLFKGCLFLKTGVISASFKLSGKLPFIKHSLKRLCKVCTEAVQHSFNILGGVVL